MKQDWEIYRNTCILGAALAVKEKLDEHAAQEKQKSSSMSKRWEDSKNGKHPKIR